MSIEIIDCAQNGPDWYEARRGLVTSSQFATVMAKGVRGGESKGRRTYLLKLAGEILTGAPMDNYSNAHMERGHEQEDEARALYAFQTGADIRQVGFIKNGRAGCSPDGLIGDRGMVEVKSKLAHLQIDQLLRGRFPPEHKAQAQGQLWVADRKWVDLVTYCPGLPLYVAREHRDEAYIDKIRTAAADFLRDLDAMVAQVHRYDNPGKEVMQKSQSVANGPSEGPPNVPPEGTREEVMHDGNDERESARSNVTEPPATDAAAPAALEMPDLPEFLDRRKSKAERSTA